MHEDRATKLIFQLIMMLRESVNLMIGFPSDCEDIPFGVEGKNPCPQDKPEPTEETAAATGSGSEPAESRTTESAIPSTGLSKRDSSAALQKGNGLDDEAKNQNLKWEAVMEMLTQMPVKALLDFHIINIIMVVNSVRSIKCVIG